MDWLTVVQSAQRAAVVYQPEPEHTHACRSRKATDMPLNGGKEQGGTMQLHRIQYSACAWISSSCPSFAHTTIIPPVHTSEHRCSEQPGSITNQPEWMPSQLRT